MTPTDEGGDDEVLARLDDGLEPATQEEARARAPYEQLIDRIRTLDPVEPRPGWDQRLETRWRAARAAARRRRLYVAAGVGAVAAAAVVLLIFSLRGAGSPTPTLHVAVVAGDGSPKRSRSTVGDKLRLSARVSGAHTAVRVYVDTRLLASCPGDPACQIDRRIIQLELPLPAAGTYRVVVLRHTAAIPPPGDGGLDGDVLAARKAGVHIEHSERLIVAP